MTVSIQLTGLKKATKSFKDIEGRTINNKPAMEKIAARGWKDVINHFEQERGPRGKWKSIKRKGQILQDTGLLRGSIRFRSIVNEAIVFSRTKYGKFHETGTSKMVVRKFMWLSSEVKKILSKMLLDYVTRG